MRAVGNRDGWFERKGKREKEREREREGGSSYSVLSTGHIHDSDDDGR